MNNPIILSLEVRFDGTFIAYDIKLNRDVREPDRAFLSKIIAGHVAPAVQNLKLVNPPREATAT